MFSSLGGGRRHSHRPRLALVVFLLVLLLVSPSILSGEARPGSNSFVKASHTTPSLFSASCRRSCSPSTPKDEVTMWLSASFRVLFPDSTIFMALSPCETESHGPLQITGGRSVKLSLSSSSRDRSCNLLSNLVSCCSYEGSLRGLNIIAENNGRDLYPGVIISPFSGFLCRNVLPICFWICCCRCATFPSVVLNAETFSIIYYPEVSCVSRTTCLLGRDEHSTLDDVRTVLMLAATGYISKTLAIVMGLRPNRDHNLGLLGYYSGYIALVFGLGFIVSLLSLNPYEPCKVGFMFFIVISLVRFMVLVRVGLKTRSTEHTLSCN